MGQLKQILAPFYWKQHVVETPVILDRHLSKINSNIEASPVLIPPNWECNVHSTCNIPELKLETGLLTEIYGKYLQEFWSDCKFPAARLAIQQPWYNSYSRNQFQEFHSHLPNDFSAVHYIVFDEKAHQATTFINPNPILGQATCQFRPSLSSKCSIHDPIHSCFATTFTPQDIRQGDLIIFPSFLNHYVKPNQSDVRRTTISFNIQVAD